MRLKLGATGLLVLYALANLCDAYPRFSPAAYIQRPAQKPAQQNPKTTVQTSKKTNQEEVNLQSKQVFTKQLTWKFPDIPDIPDTPGVEVDLRTVIPPDSVRIQCEEHQVLVEVDLDFFKTGQLINPGDMTLGGCGMVAEDRNTNKMLFQSELHNCGSVLATTNTEFIYSFTIVYTPQQSSGTVISRSNGAIVGVRCHYQRNHNVSSDLLIPVWNPYYNILKGEEILLFNLWLMTENFVNKRDTLTFYLGEMIYFEASVVQFYHVPLRVYVDSCVASATEEPNVAPNYGFIDNYGCMTDAKFTGSQSRFAQRTADDKLQFMVEAFRFQDVGRIYITCRLKATAAISPRDYSHKACSFIGGGWSAAAGPNEVCTCCDSNCAGNRETGGKGGGSNQQSGELWGEKTIGPISVIN